MNHLEKKTGLSFEEAKDLFREDLTREERMSLYREGVEEVIGDMIALREYKDEILNDSELCLCDTRELVAYIKRRLQHCNRINF